MEWRPFELRKKAISWGHAMWVYWGLFGPFTKLFFLHTCVWKTTKLHKGLFWIVAQSKFWLDTLQCIQGILIKYSARILLENVLQIQTLLLVDHESITNTFPCIGRINDPPCRQITSTRSSRCFVGHPENSESVQACSFFATLVYTLESEQELRKGGERKKVAQN